ncbi:MAG TPA: ATP-binding protein, partial [bacterium]|nr:ATP-binding protein [bacterium]
CRNGEIRIMLLSVEQLEIDGTVCLLNVSCDVIVQRTMELALRASEERYRGLLMSLPVGVYSRGVDEEEAHFFQFNPALPTMFGCDADLLRTLLFRELFTDDAVRREVGRQLRATGQVSGLKLPLRRVDGSPFWAQVWARLVRDEAGRPLRVDSVLIDISELQGAEEDLAFRNTLLTTQQECSLDGILVVDDMGMIISHNRRFAEIWHIPPDLLAARVDAPLLQHVAALTADPDNFLRRVRQLYEARDAVSRDELLLRDGRIIDRYTASLAGANGRYYGRVWYFRDITTEKKLQQRIIQSEKLSALGQLTAGIAHEINQPLGGITMGLDNMAMELQQAQPDPAFIGARCGELRQYAERIARIIEHIRIFSREQTGGRVELFVLNDSVQHALSLLRQQCRKRGIELQVELAADLPPVLGNPYRFEQVVLNLLGNARDACEARAAQPQLPPAYAPRIDLTTGCNGGQVWLEVADNGIGIAEEYRERIFDPFFTTKEPDKGTGLGLSISYGIIHEMRGTIEVDSRVGEYTRLRVLCPAARPEASGA